jgi:hypothetical protein
MVDEEDDMESYVSDESSSFRDTQRTVKKYEDNPVSSLLPVDEASVHIEIEYDSPSKIVAPLLSGGTKQTSSPLALSHRRAYLPMDLLPDIGNDRKKTQNPTLLLLTCQKNLQKSIVRRKNRLFIICWLGCDE